MTNFKTGRKKVFVVIGTRPEAIKMAPIIKQLKQEKGIISKVISTGQHPDLLDSVLSEFSITVNYNLDTYKKNQGLASLTAAILLKLELLFQQDLPDVVLVHGDTTSAFSTALACFYKQIVIFHVEAGLRSNNPTSPHPEELNRRLISQLSKYHFSVDKTGVDNLINEGISRDHITVTGNTVIDSLKAMHTKPHDDRLKPNGFENRAEITHSDIANKEISNKKLLITLHRREKGDEYIQSILCTIKQFLTNRPDVSALYPLHPNPKIRTIAYRELSDIPNLELSEPLSYSQFLKELKTSTVILTDSGGIQEEAYYLGKTTLIVRDETERLYGLDRGTTHLVGESENKLLEYLEMAFENSNDFSESIPEIYPSKTIVKKIVQYLE